MGGRVGGRRAVAGAERVWRSCSARRGARRDSVAAGQAQERQPQCEGLLFFVMMWASFVWKHLLFSFLASLEQRKHLCSCPPMTPPPPRPPPTRRRGASSGKIRVINGRTKYI